METNVRKKRQDVRGVRYRWSVYNLETKVRLKSFDLREEAYKWVFDLSIKEAVIHETVMEEFVYGKWSRVKAGHQFKI